MELWAIGGLIITVGLGAALILVVNALRTAQADISEAFRKLLDLRTKFSATEMDLAQTRANVQVLRQALVDKDAELAYEGNQRRLAESQRDELLDYVAKTADPSGLVDRIRRELLELRKLQAKPRNR